MWKFSAHNMDAAPFVFHKGAEQAADEIFRRHGVATRIEKAHGVYVLRVASGAPENGRFVGHKTLQDVIRESAYVETE